MRIQSKLPPKQTEIQPWDKLCIDLIGRYIMTLKKGGMKYAMKGKKRKYMDIYLQAMTMIYPDTGCVEC